jgi:hypothetical protein
MKKANQEIDYVEAILAMRTMLSLNHTRVPKSEMRDFVCIEAINYDFIEHSIGKQT